MVDDNPWVEISDTVAPGYLRSRRVDAAHPQDFFWSLNDAGAKSLVLTWTGQVDTHPSLPKILGVDVVLSGQMLRLSLLDDWATGQFLVLCNDLIEVTRGAGKPSQALEIIISRLGRWQHLLGKGPKNVLSELEIRGLIAELRFLTSELLPRFGPDAIELWRGPSGAPQDFQVGNGLFEIKSRSASGPPVLTVSSVEQLWAPQAKLHVVAYLIGRKPIAAGGETLKAMVDSIRAFLGSSPARGLFEEKLLETGYVDHPDFDETGYEVSAPLSYEVREGFPRLIPPSIPDGVRSVTYQIHLDACTPFLVPIDWDAILEK